MYVSVQGIILENVGTFLAQRLNFVISSICSHEIWPGMRINFDST